MIALQTYPPMTLTDEDGAIWAGVLVRFRRGPEDMKKLLMNSMLVDRHDRIAMLRRMCIRTALLEYKRELLEGRRDALGREPCGFMNAHTLH